jgi:hypothetical protein
MIFRGNHPKTDRNFVMGAIKASGQPVQWSDEPNHQMDGHAERAEWGSIWSPDDPEYADLSAFWKEFDRLKGEHL